MWGQRPGQLGGNRLSVYVPDRIPGPFFVGPPKLSFPPCCPYTFCRPWLAVPERGIVVSGKPWGVWLTPAIVAVLFAAGCSGGGQPPEDGSGVLQTAEQGTLTVAIDPTFPPMEYEQGGKIVGFDPELIQEIAKRLKLKVEFKKTEYLGILPALQEGKIDFAGSALTVREQWVQQAEFSEPYLSADQALVANISRTPNLAATALKGKTVGVLSGSTGETWAKTNLRTSSVKGLTRSDVLFGGLQTGSFAAVIYDKVAAIHLVKDLPELAVTQTIPTGEKYVFAFRQDADQLREKINGILAQLDKDGTVKQLAHKWFGPTF